MLRKASLSAPLQASYSVMLAYSEEEAWPVYHAERAITIYANMKTTTAEQKQCRDEWLEEAQEALKFARSIQPTEAQREAACKQLEAENEQLREQLFSPASDKEGESDNDMDIDEPFEDLLATNEEQIQRRVQQLEVGKPSSGSALKQRMLSARDAAAQGQTPEPEDDQDEQQALRERQQGPQTTHGMQRLMSAQDEEQGRKKRPSRRPSTRRQQK